MTASAGSDASERRMAAACVWLLASAGILLRVWRAGSASVFSDEIHAIYQALDGSWGTVLTTFALGDASIPLTLYTKAIISTVGLTEWTLRLPELFAGCLLMVLMACLALKHMRPLPSVLFTGLLALSPYAVYLSREARPYAITMALFSFACMLIFAWWRGGRRGRLMGAAVLAAFILWFHPIVAPSLLVLGLCAVAFAPRGPSGRRMWSDCALAVLAFGVIVALLLGPTAPSFLDQMGEKGGRGAANLATVERALVYVLSLRWSVPLWAWAIVAAAGAAALGRRYWRESLCVAVMLLVQALALLVVQSWLSETPYVWFRYVSHMLPFLFMLVASALGSAIGVLGRIPRAGAAPLLTSMAVLCTYAGHHWTHGRYAAAQPAGFGTHPLVFFAPVSGPKLERLAAPQEFYRKLRDELPPGSVIEAPMNIFHPVYHIYQRIHGRSVYVGAGAADVVQRPFQGVEGVRMRRAVDLANFRLPPDPSLRYLIVHKHFVEEYDVFVEGLGRLSYARDEWPAEARRLYRIMAENLELTGDGIPEEVRRSLAVAYEDRWVVVYDLRAGRPGGDTAATPCVDGTG